MAWIILTEADALSVVNAKLLEAARTKVVASGQPDPLVEKLAQTVGDVRGAVAASGKWVLGAGDTIPSRLKGTALDLFAVRILGRLDLEVSTVKMDLYKSAERKLEAVRKGTDSIEEAATPSEETPQSYTPEVSGRERQWGRDAQDGI